ncbi:hypothetical protein Ddye_001995 [Dipteronia dyeriana]|uniref:Uncharacterized protein n=1 Tax=Dipteronia dyeriana TaxID=168575 RepID=A0AAD9XPH7_9ROSI|nr:hypothetical protein Ddye_001995 [Dipteronia dyeriana]
MWDPLGVEPKRGQGRVERPGITEVLPASKEVEEDLPTAQGVVEDQPTSKKVVESQTGLEQADGVAEAMPTEE